MRYGLDLVLIAGCAGGVLRVQPQQLRPGARPRGRADALGLLLGVPRPRPALARLGPAAVAAGRLLVLTHGRRPLARLSGRSPAASPAPSAPRCRRQRRRWPAPSCCSPSPSSFAVSTATFNATYQQQAEVDAQLTNGADVTVTEPPGAPTRPGQRGRGSPHVPGVRHVEPLQHRFAYVGSDLQDLYGVRPVTITTRHLPAGRLLPGRHAQAS